MDRYVMKLNINNKLLLESKGGGDLFLAKALERKKYNINSILVKNNLNTPCEE